MATLLPAPAVLEQRQDLPITVESPKAKKPRQSTTRPRSRKPKEPKTTPRRAKPESDGPKVDLFLVYTPPTRPAPPRHGVKRWARNGIIYREVSFDKICADPYENTRSFHQYDGLIRARPYRG